MIRFKEDIAMAKLVIEVELDGAAFEDAGAPIVEVRNILQTWLARMENEDPFLEPWNVWGLRDTNGNTVGTARVAED